MKDAQRQCAKNGIEWRCSAWGAGRTALRHITTNADTSERLFTCSSFPICTNHVNFSNKTLFFFDKLYCDYDEYKCEKGKKKRKAEKKKGEKRTMSGKRATTHRIFK